MIDLEHDDIKLMMLAGLPIEINGLGQLRQLTLKQIASIGESVYFNKYVSPLLFNKNNFEELRELDMCDYEVLANIANQNQSFKQAYIESLEFFFNDKAELFTENNMAFFYLGEKREERFITKDTFETIKKAALKINNLQEPKDEEQELVPGNERARKFMEKLKLAKSKAPKSKPTKNLSSIISGLAWKPNGINITSIWDLTLYQLYDGYYRTENIDYFSNIMSAIYAGTIDQKGIDLSKINWANIIKIN